MGREVVIDVKEYNELNDNLWNAENKVRSLEQELECFKQLVEHTALKDSSEKYLRLVTKDGLTCFDKIEGHPPTVMCRKVFTSPEEISSSLNLKALTRSYRLTKTFLVDAESNNVLFEYREV